MLCSMFFCTSPFLGFSLKSSGCLFLPKMILISVNRVWLQNKESAVIYTLMSFSVTHKEKFCRMFMLLFFIEQKLTVRVIFQAFENNMLGFWWTDQNSLCTDTFPLHWSWTTLTVHLWCFFCPFRNLKPYLLQRMEKSSSNILPRYSTLSKGESLYIL